MKIFISWSGESSRLTAEKLSNWLKAIFQQSVEIFMSAKDIEKGDRWADRLGAALEDYSVGIVVLNRSNKDKPWVCFEAGALSKSVSNSSLIPLLCGLTPGDLLNSPLGQFQAAEATEVGVREIASSINNLLDKKLSEENLAETMDVWWEKKGAPVCAAAAVSDQGESESEPKISLKDILARMDRTDSAIAGMFGEVNSRLELMIEAGMVEGVRLSEAMPRPLVLNMGIGKSSAIADLIKLSKVSRETEAQKAASAALKARREKLLRDENE